MQYGRAIWAWIGSVVTYAGILLAGWVGTMGLRGPQSDFEQRATAGLVGFCILFAMTSALVYVPIFTFLDSWLRRPMNRTKALLVGAGLAIVPRLIMAWRFGEFESPTAWVGYWVRHPTGFPLGFLPFVIAGAVFGLLWPQPDPRSRTAPLSD